MRSTHPVLHHAEAPGSKHSPDFVVHIHGLVLRVDLRCSLGCILFVPAPSCIMNRIEKNEAGGGMWSHVLHIRSPGGAWGGNEYR